MPTNQSEAWEPKSLQPRDLIGAIYGLYAGDYGDWISVSALIQLMEQLNVDEPSVRGAVSRLKRRGVLEAQKSRGSAGYVLSQQARETVAEGDRRNFGRQRAALGEGWLLAVFSVPEKLRHQRHVLRSRLSWLGFGTTAPGVWIAPRCLSRETREVLERHGLSNYIDLFEAEYLAFGNVSELVGRWWDLDKLQQLHREFINLFSPVLERWRDDDADQDAEAFSDYLLARAAWRQLPFLDPGLPLELLPEDWLGARAASLLDQLRERLNEPARRFAEAIMAEGVPPALADTKQQRVHKGEVEHARLRSGSCAHATGSTAAATARHGLPLNHQLVDGWRWDVES